MMKGLVNGVSASILVDIRVATTVLSKGMWDQVKEKEVQLQTVSDWRLVRVQGTSLYLHGSAHIQLELPPEKFSVNVIVADTPSADVILAHDFLRCQVCTIEMGSTSDVLHVKSNGQSFSIAQNQSTQCTSTLTWLCKSTCQYHLILKSR